MPEDLIVPAVLVTLALVAYTAGVWGERLQRDLLPWHLAAFWLGLLFDATGSWAMERLLDQSRLDVHTLTGAAALLLMLAHAAWATRIRVSGSAEGRRTFHRYSLAVWALWLVPYVGGMIAGISRGAS